MFDWIRAAPGISATSPSSGTTTTISAFGSGSNENQFLIDGTNTTCPCNGVARSEPGVDFIQEVQIQSVGASAEFGNVQGAVVNVITRQGSDRFLYDASYFGQPAGLTGEPVNYRFPVLKPRVVIIATDITTRPRTSADLPSAIACGSSAGTSTCAITTASPAPTRICRESTSRTSCLRNSPGASRHRGSSCRAITWSDGPIPSSRRFPNRSKQRCGRAAPCQPSHSVC